MISFKDGRIFQKCVRKSWNWLKRVLFRLSWISLPLDIGGSHDHYNILSQSFQSIQSLPAQLGFKRVHKLLNFIRCGGLKFVCQEILNLTYEHLFETTSDLKEKENSESRLRIIQCIFKPQLLERSSVSENHPPFSKLLRHPAIFIPKPH